MADHRRSTPVTAPGRALAAGREHGAPRVRLQTRDNLLGVALLAPTLLIFAVMIIYPILYGTSLGFYSVQPITLNTRFVGLDNFAQILTPGGPFLSALWIGLLWAAGGTALQVVAGVGVAVLLNQPFFGRSVARGLALFPYLVPIIVAVTVWRWIFNDVYGILNHALLSLGLISRPVPWLSSPDWALLTVILVGTWRLFPFITIAVLSRLQTIPTRLYDAAKADGASSWAMFWDITVPQLRGVLVISIFIRFIWDFEDFNLIALLTGGGPAASTQTLPLLIHQYAFIEQKFGLAAATADVMLILQVVLFLLYFRVTRAAELE